MIYHEFEYELPSGLVLGVQLELETPEDWSIGGIYLHQGISDDSPSIEITETADQLFIDDGKKKVSVADFLENYISYNVHSWYGDYWEAAQERKVENY